MLYNDPCLYRTFYSFSIGITFATEGNKCVDIVYRNEYMISEFIQRIMRIVCGALACPIKFLYDVYVIPFEWPYLCAIWAWLLFVMR